MDQHHHPENDAEYAGLQVNAGVEQPPAINPYFRPKMRQPRLNAQAYIDGILSGDITVLSQAVTLVESNLPSDQLIAQKVIEAHPNEVSAYKGGKVQLLGFFVGQVMKETKGRANPKTVNELVRKILEG